MQSSILPRWSLIACAAASLALPPVVGAAELGEMAVLSHVGQPLLAEIELTALVPEEASGVAVRLGTLWLTPAPPAAAPVSAPVRPAVPAPMPAPLPLPRPVPVAPSPDAAALAARARAEGLVRPARVFVPPPAAPTPAAPVQQRPAPVRRATAPVAACAPQADMEQAQACVALDEKNTALNAKLGELEGKIGALQKALALPAAAAPVVAEVPHAKPKPLHAAPAADKEKKAGGNGLLWLGIGTLLFLLLTAVIVYVVRKRRQAAGPGAPSKYWVLLRKPFSRKKKDVPVLTEAVEEGAAEAEPEPFSR